MFAALFLAMLIAQDFSGSDAAYGLILHNQITAEAPLIPREQVVPVLREVFAQLTATEFARSMSVVPQTLFYQHRPEINAWSGAGGRLYVTDAFVASVEGNKGVIAFALGHELAHSLLQHAIKKYVRQVQRNQQIAALQRQIALGDKNARWAVLAFLVADKISSAKIDRDYENDADRMGLMISAEAGYHPDFAILAARTLREKLGEQSKFGAFFSDHPRWTTREERAEMNFPAALTRFTMRWPSLDVSPGGTPPPIAGASDPAVRRVPGGYIISSTVFVRNIKQQPMAVRLKLTDDGDTPIVMNTREFVEDTSEAVSTFVPDEALRKRHGHQVVQVVLERDGARAYSSAAKRIK